MAAILCLMQEFHRSNRSFLVVLHIWVNLLSSAAGVSKRCPGSSRSENHHKVTCWNTSHACGGSLLPRVCREDETQHSHWKLGSNTTGREHERCSGWGHSSWLWMQGQQPAHTWTGRVHSTRPWGETGLFSKVHLTCNGRLKESKSWNS